jgi:uncharacterized protein (DUF362 family)
MAGKRYRNVSKERVAIVKVVEQDIDAALERMAGLLGGLESLVPRGSRVLIKPNFVFAPTDRGITHPELVEAVVRLAAETAPREILVGEGSADVYTTQSYRFQGMNRVAARYGARLVDLNLEEGVKSPVPPGLGREYIMVPRAVAQCDVLISLPVFKLWGGSPLSLSLKNLIGLYGARYYGHNKDSRQRANDSGYALPGEVGSELGAHQPRAPMSICALNSAVRTHLAIVDGLEGGDGRGNFIRLDTLIAGRNPVATDTVACAMAGVKASEHEQFHLCAERGLGPDRLDQIEVVGERIEDVSFELARLHDNVLEMPIGFCLNLLSVGELQQVQRALQIYGLVAGDASQVGDRDILLAMLGETIAAEGYYERALAKCTDYARALLGILAERGGTSGSMVDVERAFGERFPGLYYYPSHRVLARLGLAYAVDSRTRPYYLLPKGVVDALQRLEREEAPAVVQAPE